MYVYVLGKKKVGRKVAWRPATVHSGPIIKQMVRKKYTDLGLGLSPIYIILQDFFEFGAKKARRAGHIDQMFYFYHHS